MSLAVDEQMENVADREVSFASDYLKVLRNYHYCAHIHN